MSTIAIIVAAGRGKRAATTQSAPPKQFALLAGKPLLSHTIDALERHRAIDRILVAIHPGDASHYAGCAASGQAKLLAPVAGGATRQASVRAALESLVRDPPDIVLIHDAARPFVDSALITRVMDGLAVADASLPGIPVSDTLKRVEGRGAVLDTLSRTALWRAQTPQAARFRDALAAHRAAAAAGLEEFTDDAALLQWHGLTVHMVEGSEANVKITTADDLARSDMALRAAAREETRTGQGFDVHRFTKGDHVWLCGVRIPHTHALDGHSDADVALHALTDALLGAIGDGDIGQHFPPSDERWRGAPSQLFLTDAAQRVARRGGRIVNVDVTLLCEAPRIGPHRVEMATRIAEILALTADRVGVKATTTERLGFTGRREGIAAMAIATIVLPDNR